MRETLPTPEELAQAPELALVEEVNVALELLVRMLIVAHPELADQDFPRKASEAAILADRIQSLAFKQQAALAQYRYAIHKAHLPDPADADIPF